MSEKARLKLPFKVSCVSLISRVEGQMLYKSIKALGNLIVLWPQSGLKAEWQLSLPPTSAPPPPALCECAEEEGHWRGSGVWVREDTQKHANNRKEGSLQRDRGLLQPQSRVHLARNALSLLVYHTRTVLGLSCSPCSLQV